jgi:hypothetical protein
LLSKCSETCEYQTDQTIYLLFEEIGRNGFGEIGEKPDRLSRQRVRWPPGYLD